jgi:hypothetical protein
VGSRSLEKAAQACEQVRPGAAAGCQVTPCASATADELRVACEGAELIIAAGAAGAELLPLELRKTLESLKVAIDVNAVPPVGIAGVEPFDKGTDRDGVICYGAIGVGGLKMKIHNDHVLELASIYAIGEQFL